MSARSGSLKKIVAVVINCENVIFYLKTWALDFVHFVQELQIVFVSGPFVNNFQYFITSVCYILIWSVFWIFSSCLIILQPVTDLLQNLVSWKEQQG